MITTKEIHSRFVFWKPKKKKKKNFRLGSVKMLTAIMMYRLAESFEWFNVVQLQK